MLQMFFEPLYAKKNHKKQKNKTLVLLDFPSAQANNSILSCTKKMSLFLCNCVVVAGGGWGKWKKTLVIYLVIYLELPGNLS